MSGNTVEDLRLVAVNTAARYHHNLTIGRRMNDGAPAMGTAFMALSSALDAARQLRDMSVPTTAPDILRAAAAIAEYYEQHARETDALPA